MGNLGAGEILILAFIALLVFGGKGLPEAGRSIGRGLREFRRALSDVRDAVERPDEPPPSGSPPDSTPGSSGPKRLLE
jgi:sec-independent protein translocase protein TatA